MTEASPVNGVRKGEPLAGDGPVCGARCHDGSECQWPARYGRSDVEDSDDTHCFMHDPEGELCGAPTNWGSSCRMPAGWGTDHQGEGVCCMHSDVVRKDRDKTKAEFLLAYDEFKVQRRACEHVGVTERVIQLWRKIDEGFDEAVEALQASLEGRRVTAVEESLYERAVRGNASAAEVVLWLCNRAPDRWQDVKRIRHDVNHSGGVLVVPGAPDPEEWGEMAQRQQKKLAEETGTGDAARAIEIRGREVREG